MCSILGYIAYTNQDSDFIPDALSFMRHRGPDHEGSLKLKNVCLGHQRLSIIDLDARSNQPFSIGDHAIVFNGEIYNFKELRKKYLSSENLSTTSDTEVLLLLLRKFGLSVLNELNGMFAFAWFNSQNNSLTLVRDRFGVKPLYYTFYSGNFYFSSEMRPLIHLRNTVEWRGEVISNFLNNNIADESEETFQQSILQLKAGHLLSMSTSSGALPPQKRWYHFNDFTIDANRLRSFSDATNYTEELLTDAIRIRLMADVPLALTLSGGIDSSLIYTLIKANLREDIKVFSFDHSGSDLDETNSVKELARKWGGDIQWISADQEESVPVYLKSLQHLEFPIWSSAHIAFEQTYSKIRDLGYTVILEGHGSDENFGGYPNFVWHAFNDLLNEGKYRLAYQVYHLGYAMLNRNLLPNRYQLEKVVRDMRALMFMGKKAFQRSVGFKKIDTALTLQQRLDDARDISILPMVLRCFDRITMAHHLESRAPFMDYRIVELSRALPVEYKMNALGTKAVLRNILMQKGFFSIAANKKKTGFSSDITRFFNSEKNREFIKSKLNSFDPDTFGVKGYPKKKEYSARLNWQEALQVSKEVGLQCTLEYLEQLTNHRYAK